MWGALSDERTGLSFTVAAGVRQRSHSRVRVSWDSRPYFTVSDSRLPFSSSPTTRRVTVEVFDSAPLPWPPFIGSGSFVTVEFSGMGLSLSPTPNLEDQKLHSVWPLPFDLSGMGGTTKSLCSRQHSSLDENFHVFLSLFNYLWAWTTSDLTTGFIFRAREGYFSSSSRPDRVWGTPSRL
jgi:hypothetical protein